MVGLKLPENKFDWIKEISQFNEDFIENYNEESDKRYLLEFDVQYLEKLQKVHNDLPFLPEERNLKKSKSFQLIYMIKMNMLYT